jgi:DNA-binding NarL/FixJ family response regulator
VRVVVADDSLIVRRGVESILREAGVEVVGSCGDGDELVELVARSRPDVAIVDVRMPPTFTDEGLRAAREVRERHPETGVLILSQYVEVGHALQLLTENAAGLGYVLKDRVTDLEAFDEALKRVAAGGSVLDPIVVAQLVARRRDGDPLGALSPRELEVLGLVAEGRSNKAIAERLVITLGAVQKHVSSIFARLKIPAGDDDQRRVLAVLSYLRA